MRIAAALVAFVCLSGCGANLLAPPGSPPALYTLSAPQQIATAGGRIGWQLLVNTPDAALDLDSSRIALSPAANRVDYYANVAWVDRAPILIERMMVESFERSGRIAAVERQSGGLRSDFLLASDLRDFQVDVGASVVRVRIGTKLERTRDRSIVARRTFDIAEPVASNDFAAVIAAFEGGLAKILPQIVDWTLDAGNRNP